MEKRKVGRPKKEGTLQTRNFKCFKDNIIADFFTVDIVNKTQLKQHLEFQKIPLLSNDIKNSSFFVVVKRWLEVTAFAQVDVEGEIYNINFLQIIDEKNKDLAVQLIQDKISYYKK